MNKDDYKSDNKESLKYYFKDQSTVQFQAAVDRAVDATENDIVRYNPNAPLRAIFWKVFDSINRRFEKMRELILQEMYDSFKTNGTKCRVSNETGFKLVLHSEAADSSGYDTLIFPFYLFGNDFPASFDDVEREQAEEPNALSLRPKQMSCPHYQNQNQLYFNAELKAFDDQIKHLKEKKKRV